MLKSLLVIKNGDDVLDEALFIGFIIDIRRLLLKMLVAFPTDFCSTTSNATVVRSTVYNYENEEFYYFRKIGVS